MNWNDYRDKWGLTTDKPDGVTTMNGLLWTALELYARYRGKTLPASESNRFARLAQDCLMSPPHAGILMRTPDNKHGQESHDNTYALAYIAVRTGQTYLPYRWVTHGLRSRPIKWTFNNVNPKKFSLSAWLGRFPHLVCTMKLAGASQAPGYSVHIPGGQLYPLETWAWEVSQKRALKNMRRGKNVEAAMHAVLRNEVALLSSCDRLRPFALAWDNEFQTKWPGGLGTILEPWGRDKHWKKHPIVLTILGRS